MTDFTTRPLAPGTWKDFERVMGSNGGARGCWCMHWRLPFKEWQAGAGDGNRDALRTRSAQRPPPGLVCYLDDEPVGWVGIGARPEYPRLRRSPVTKALDTAPVWVINCLFVRRDHRHRGLQTKMITAACGFAAENGQRTVEGFPVDPAPGRTAGADNAMTGIASAFRAAGFTEVARRRKDRPAMRRTVDGT
ncbi:GNAT family N-acetyltransferase [Streptomyces sp. SID4919]|uniref:GNAT family N-acetyltransferase n=1 Tax=unclassified Streptomyces TaxID=2593676 RepID=UPI000823D0C5|nr:MULTISPECIES: GNAT family N-acetyltransferase [unclassified Streptomyces]MYY09298.1 GNAT family N-acetyltransferase [Streptomyces sp. SID4919]SCK42554.1 Acetyltransferase (GNAT) family protein [Streptomyces sp. AmelKG-E11A]